MHGFYTYTLDLDFKMLRKQKEFLLNHGGPDAMGLVGMIDAIQDYAVDNDYLTEKEVFGDLDEKETD